MLSLGLGLVLASPIWVNVSAAEPDAIENETVEIIGLVLDEAAEPIVGAAIQVESARPRRGSATQCPTCYPDLKKKTLTNDKGEFTLAAMDGGLTFRLLVMKKGYEPKLQDRVDPLRGPVNVTLWKREAADPSRVMIVTRVYGPEGKAVSGAVLDMDGAETGNMTTWGGHTKYVQDVAVSDENGILTVWATPELKAGRGLLSATGFAKQWVRVVPGTDHLFVLGEGTTVSGQAVKNGKPVAGLVVGFAGVDRSAGEFIRGWEVATDAQGRFSFASLTPGKNFNVYSTGRSAAKLGALPDRQITTTGDGAKLDLGKLELSSTLHVKGRVVFADGQPVFPGTKILVSRERAWDSQEATLDDDGKFEINGLVPDRVDVHLRLAGY